MTPLRVLVLEINEISWELMEPWLATKELKNFLQLREEGAWGETIADERSDLLEPWVTWITAFTGVPQAEHGAKFLEQPAETIRAKRIWDYAHDAGKKIGIFGSVGSWPPRPVNGFFVPGSFSPDSQTYPEDLRPIQDLNLKYTRAHMPGAQKPGLLSALGFGIRLWRRGLNLPTCWKIFKTLVETKIWPGRSWKKVSLQPIVNLAFFRKLFRQTQPDLATFHTNHVAHYQHRFFRAWKPECFPDPTEGEEIHQFHDAIHYGYKVADQLVGEMIGWCRRQPDLVLCVASSMGQKPWIPERYASVAPSTCRIRSIEKLLEILGIRERCQFFSVMAPQWNLRMADSEMRQRVIGDLQAARYQPLNKPMYVATEVKDSIVVTPVSYHELNAVTECVFATLQNSPRFAFSELVMQDDETRKSGCHDPVGMIALYGQAIRGGRYFGQVNTLSIAPTLLSLMGLPIPQSMKARCFADDCLAPNRVSLRKPVIQAVST